MKITKITPRGFCQGVVNAWIIAKKVREQNPDSDIYMVGWLVHNNELIKNLDNIGIKTIDDTNESRVSIVEKMKTKKNIILIFSAHGTDEKAFDIAKENNITFFDTTCEYVKKTHNIIKEKLNQNYNVIFIGKKNHPETISVLSIDKNIIFVENENDINNIQFSKNKKYFLTNQTTMSIYDFYLIIKKIKEKKINIEIKNDICTATKERQEAIINMDDDVDLLIVVGDKKSNNSNKLKEIGKSRNIESYLISNVNEFNDQWLNNKKHLAITSGASTPTWVTNEVIEYIEKKVGKNG